MGELKRKRGRPVSDRSKRNFCGLRISDEDVEMLEYIAKTTGETRTDIIRGAIKMHYNLCKARYD